MDDIPPIMISLTRFFRIEAPKRWWGERAMPYTPKIFMIDRHHPEVSELFESPYERESILQKHLADHPDLIPGDQINIDNPRKWIIVQREMGIPSSIDGSDLWSVDHLFLDQDGIPTFIECKRSSDTRGRREVVAQMLDYAANATEFWNIDKIIKSANETYISKKTRLEDELSRILDIDEIQQEDIDRYWDAVKENLKNKKLRLVFVGDKCHPDLRRLVEFLNSKLEDVEVLAVEIKQFTGDNNKKILVPTVLGMTEEVRKKKSDQRKGIRIKNAQDAFELIDIRYKPLAEYIFQETESKKIPISWNRGSFSLRSKSLSGRNESTFMYFHYSGKLEFFFPKDSIVPEKERYFVKNIIISEYGFVPKGNLSADMDINADNDSALRRAIAFVIDRIYFYPTVGMQNSK